MARKRRHQQQFERAVLAHTQGRIGAAVAGYRRLLAARPRDHEVCHQLGLALWQQDNLAEALPLLEAAVRGAPAEGRYWSNLGNARQSAGRIDSAIAAYESAIERDPSRQSAWSGLGVALRIQGRLPQAIAALQQAIALPGAGAAIWQNLGSTLAQDAQHHGAVDALSRAIGLQPDDAQTHNALGNSLLALGEWASAEAAYRQALEHEPLSPVYRTNLGILLQRRGKPEAAMDAFEAAIAEDPAYVDAYTHFGLLLRAGGHIEPAIATWRRGLSIRPTPEAWLNLASALIELGHEDAGIDNLRHLLRSFPAQTPARLALAGALISRGERGEAEQHYERVLTAHPQHAEALHFLRALRQEDSERAPAAYVRKLFDDYAVRFDQHLVGELGYRTPQRLAALIDTVRQGPLGRVGDLGCGTGLMGALLRPRCAELVGIDLSAEMIHQARSKGLYDDLQIGEIESLLPELGVFDVLVATDVLIYIGALDELLTAAAAALSPDGLLALTTEHLSGEGWSLQPSGRYAHSAAEISALAERNGLSILASAVEPIRQERGAWIDGGLYVLQR